MSTYMEIVEADDANPNTIKEPAKRWRNWWRTSVVARGQDGNAYGPGAFHGPRTFPSKDAAESDALPKAARNHVKAKRMGVIVEYLGAFPEGESP